MTTTIKTCFKCNTEKPLDDFYKHSRMADGHLNKCKDCTKNDSFVRRNSERRAYVLEYERARAKSPLRIEKAKETIKRWQSCHEERRKAHAKLSYAVKSGSVKRLDCFICGEKAEAHHPDYSRPLDVVWLCSSHHKQAHALAKKLG